MPRPSLVTSSGPSPVRGFIAAILPSPSSGSYRARRTGSAYAAIAVPAVKPASHNRFYLSPYYPVFGSRLVMIADPCRDENVRNGFLAGRLAISPARRLDHPAATPAARLTRGRAARLLPGFRRQRAASAVHSGDREKPAAPQLARPAAGGHGFQLLQ